MIGFFKIHYQIRLEARIFVGDVRGLIVASHALWSEFHKKEYRKPQKWRTNVVQIIDQRSTIDGYPLIIYHTPINSQIEGLH